MPLRCLLGDGDRDFVSRRALRPEQVLLCGARDLDPPEAEYVAAHGITVVGVEALERDPEAVARVLCERGFTAAYVHLDVDVLDPAAWPWSVCPTPGGLSVAALLRLLGALRASCDVVGASVVEVALAPETDRELLRTIVEACWRTVARS
eukprot:TRINITY_DN18341_c0_g1_i1.p2 TRINITY_DN18341_c0_g1~~TRINITY_DN18341_c0_g1_i1.p2  ORF type:complete len:150 (-),score=41.84 TRINITY_DN18341_c0_g1_i1:41-490(-)